MFLQKILEALRESVKRADLCSAAIDIRRRCGHKQEALRSLWTRSWALRPPATAREPAKSAAWRLKVTFWLDMAMLVSVCALQTVRFTGLALHEWLGLAIVAMVLEAAI